MQPNRIGGAIETVSYHLIPDSALATDLYEVTMAAAYFDNHEDGVGTFELFVRNLPKNRSYLLAAGLEQALDYVMKLRFKKEHIEYLRKHPTFEHVSNDFFEYLLDFKFTGDAHALPEGTVFFQDEPVLRIKAPIVEAQLLETYLLAVLNFETLIATKAARVVQSARGRGVVEFGSRRAHGPEAALLAARASYIGGCVGTSNVLAGYLFGIPTFGTMAHSYVMTYDNEEEAFEKFCKVFPGSPALLIDTYDTLEGARKATVAKIKPSVVRLDSGDRFALSKQVREVLDEAGLRDTKIFVSGDLNEYTLHDFTSRNAPMDQFGVGTELVTSRDDPALSGIYKLVALEKSGKQIYRVKTSEGKQTIPGAKQVYRRLSRQGEIIEDIVSLADEPPLSSASPLLIKVIEQGRLTHSSPKLEEIQEKAKRELTALPVEFKQLTGTHSSPVRLSGRLRDLTNSLWQSHNRSRG